MYDDAQTVTLCHLNYSNVRAPHGHTPHSQRSSTAVVGVGMREPKVLVL